MKVKDLFREVKYPIELFNKNGNRIYYEYDSNGKEIYSENATGYWIKREFDSNGNVIYYEDSDGTIEDNRPKKELTMDQISKKFNIPIDQLKIKKE